MQSFWLIFIGGGCGASARHAFSTYLGKALTLHSTWAIVIINLIGCLLIGFCAEALLRLPNPAWRYLLITGFLGGFTTYSTFTYDLISLVHKAPIQALMYFASHLFGGVLACGMGMLIAKALH